MFCAVPQADADADTKIVFLSQKKSESALEKALRWAAGSWTNQFGSLDGSLHLAANFYRFLNQPILY